MKLMFGRFKGRPLDNVPRDYLEWLLSRDIDDYLREGIKAVLAEWDAMKKPKGKKRPVVEARKG